MRAFFGVIVLVAAWCGSTQTGSAAAPRAGTLLINRAIASYIPAGYSQRETIESIAVEARILGVEVLDLTQDQSLLRPPGAAVRFAHLLANTGNDVSRYTFALANGGAGCAADSLDLGSLRLVRDVNANGVIDANDTPLPLGSAGALQLAPDEIAALIVEGILPAGAGSGAACVSLTATADDSGVSETNVDDVTVTHAASIVLTKTASHAGIVQPGSSTIDFTVVANNIGATGAVPTLADPTGTRVIVDGRPVALVLLRDAVPAGTRYVMGSLQTRTLDAVRLFRLPADAPLNYRTAGDDASAVEVAIGLPGNLARNASVSMSFAVRVAAEKVGPVLNTSYANFGIDAGTGLEERSNTVIIPVTAARIGLAKAGLIIAGTNAQETSDGTATVRFTLRTRNYGSTPLHDVQITDLLEGGGTQFGSYSPAAIPGAGEYTVVAGSLRVVGRQGAGTSATVRSDFTGQTSRSQLLEAGATLPAGGEITVELDVRFNVTGRPAVLYNTAETQAALYQAGPPSVSDRSVNGNNPDPDGNENPGDDASPTPVTVALPTLSLTKSVTMPRRGSAPGTYEFDYALTIANTGDVGASSVRVIDNLDCTFRMDLPDTPFASWELLGAPRVGAGLLQVAAGFTGRAPCDRAALESENPSYVPREPALSLTDGNRALAPGESETITFTVRATLKPAVIGTRVNAHNDAWAVSYDSNANTNTGAVVLASAAAHADVLLVDPQGIVYNAVTRQAVAGAIVTMTREACTSGAPTPILPAEIFYGDHPGLYTYGPDGSVSLVTPVSGEYQFFFRSPPVNDLCTYRLRVQPPEGSGLVAPSALIPPQPGTFESCGAVVPNAIQPVGADPTTWHPTVRAGRSSATNELCEVFHNHIPLDPQALNGLVLEKKGGKSEAELGDFVDYTLSLTNSSGIALSGLRFTDRLPPGFAYVPDSTRVDGQPAADPLGGRGPQLIFDLAAQTLRAGGSIDVTYRLRIGVGSTTSGDAINRAQVASGTATTQLVSNEASWRVRVRGGVFSDEAFLFGKVFLDCDRDGVQGHEEVGIPGVRLFIEDGTSVVTDVEGKWSLYGLKPVTRALKLDDLTLPKGARLARIDNRQGNRSGTRFVDLKKGEWHKANFAVDNCELKPMKDEVFARRKMLAFRPDAEGEAARMRQRLDPSGKPVEVADPRALPASGRLAPDGSVQSPSTTESPLIELPNAAAPLAESVQPFIPVFDPMLPPGVEEKVAPTPAMKPLEEVILGLDNTLAFLGLAQGDVVPGRVINVRIKGKIGTTLRLKANGLVVEERRVGKKSTLPTTNLTAWEYIGVSLVAGENELTAEEMDEFGRVRRLYGIKVIAPDKLARISLEIPATARADGSTPVPIRVRLVDERGVPVTLRTAITLESSAGRWQPKDLDAEEPGTQIFIENGMAECPLIPPAEPGDGRVRVSTSGLVTEARLAFLPDLRPLTGVGIVEGVINLNKRGSIALGAPRARDAFEAELRGLSRESGETKGAARAAFYFKGTIKGEYLLTAAYDSDHDERERLFRDIRPDEFYPIYGDSAQKTFDAQSTERLYVRIDKNRSWLLYGDFTSDASTEVRQLSQTNRSLTGLQHQYENSGLRIKTYGSQASLKQKIEEFPANGTSGPYSLGGGVDLLDNSERVEIVVRDRNQLNVVLRTTALTRFTDYSIEPLARRLLLTSPVSSLDPELNPQSIRVTYEVDTGGPEFWVGGVDAQAKLGEHLQLGIAGATDEDPDNVRRLAAVTALARLGEHTTLAAEAVGTRSELKGDGNAARLELRHDNDVFNAQVQAGRTSAEFDNPGAAMGGGRTEASARLEYKMTASTRVRGELIDSRDNDRDDQRRGAALSVQQRMSKYVTAELGARMGERTVTGQGGFDYGTVSSPASGSNTPSTQPSVSDDFITLRGRLTANLPGSRGELFVEGEQAVEEQERRVAAVGGQYRLSQKLRAYGRYEFISTLFGGRYDLEKNVQNNLGVFGLESEYMKGGRVFSEYRVRDSIDGRASQAAFGLRNTFSMSEALQLTGGAEYTGAERTVDGRPGGPAVAVTSGFEYGGRGVQAGRMRASGTLELRRSDSGDSILNTLGYAFKLDRDWSFLARSIVSDTLGHDGGSDQLLARQQVGFSYRPVDQDLWNALGRYEHRLERSSGGTALSQEERAHILSAHFNVQPSATLAMNGRYAVKWIDTTYAGLQSQYWAQLVFARVTRDLAPNWDLGVQAGVMFGEGGAQQRIAGLETGYQVASSLWLSLGYNLLGVDDPDLAGADYLDNGVYLRLRFKFDEGLFK